MNDSVMPFRSYALLDNPIWNSLITRHAALGVGAEVGRGLARRYPAGIGPLSGFQEPTLEAYADLAAIVPEGDVAVLFLDEAPRVPSGWQLVRGGRLVQMVCPAAPEQPGDAGAMVRLGPADFPEMVELAALTEPGPFRNETGLLGGYVGIRVDGRLAAMAGRRLSLPGFGEVSAVCTHPEFRGRGYARALVAAVSCSLHDEGRVPFLTAYEANEGAIRVYEQVGFAIRRSLELVVLRPPSRGEGGALVSSAEGLVGVGMSGSAEEKKSDEGE